MKTVKLEEHLVDFNVYESRRKELLGNIKEMFPKAHPASVVLIFADFEGERSRFRQESSFYYLTGIQEPGVALMLSLQAETTLFIPKAMQARAQWVDMPIAFEQKNATRFKMKEITYLGDAAYGYQLNPFFSHAEYNHLVARLESVKKDNGTVFTLYPAESSGYFQQRFIIERLIKMNAISADMLQDISSVVASMRRRKDMHEIDLLYKAIDVTSQAQFAAAGAIGPNVSEAEVQAALEYMFIGNNCWAAFPSIVAGGKNSTVLHYNNSRDVLKNNDLVVIDIGAEYNYYCADLTRTYPVSGKFTKRQKELYTIVLDTQQHVADKARIGMWLSNKEYPEMSLHHIAHAYLAKYKVDQFFVHGIGHFLGMDVHDVGDRSKPLQEGDVFTIEPGVYLPQEAIGIRIEDDYWMVKDGVVCLSEQLPKSVDQVEEMVQEKLEAPDDVDFNDEFARS